MAALGSETGGYSSINVLSMYWGSGTAPLNSCGTANTQVVSAGISPGATGADNVLAVYTIPANTFDGIVGTNRGLMVTVAGSFGANGNNKRIKVIYNPTSATIGSTVSGGTNIADTGTVTTNASGWVINVEVFKYGNPNSNTQIAIHQQAQVGSATSALVAPTLLTATENVPIMIAVTGNATTTASDIVLNFFQVYASN